MGFIKNKAYTTWKKSLRQVKKKQKEVDKVKKKYDKIRDQYVNALHKSGEKRDKLRMRRKK